MKNLLATGSVIALLALSGCSTPPPGTGTGTGSGPAAPEASTAVTKPSEPNSGRAATDPALTDKARSSSIKAALASVKELDGADGIEVVVEAGAVKLTGVVKTEDQKKLATTTALAALPKETMVNNLITVDANANPKMTTPRPAGTPEN